MNYTKTQKKISKLFKNKTVLITGGTGSFGNEFLELILNLDCKIRIFSRDELKQEEMRIRLNNSKLSYYIGDVRDIDSVNNAMKGVNYVFHAAALKQVPSCEFFPSQAINTNILGSQNVIRSAISNNVSKMVCLSTDKAVYPINAMGMSKALMEKVVRAESRNLKKSSLNLSIVRYGNVMCSRGSVIPLFINQILSKEPITITNPNMTRFLLPLPYAIELVIFAFLNSNQGDLFIKKSPACTVLDLVKALTNIFKIKSDIKNIGIRHGEKLYETLATSEELNNAKDLGEYFQISSDKRDLNYNNWTSKGNKRIIELKDYTSHNTERLNIKQIEELLLTLPEVTSSLKK